MVARERRVEVAVVGAGAAGLACAATLAAAGVEVLVVEARRRIGGRVHTVRFASEVVELGAQVVHGRAGSMWDIVRAHALTCQPLARSPRLRLVGPGGHDLATRLPEGLSTPWHLAHTLDTSGADPGASVADGLAVLGLPDGSARVARAWLEQVCAADATDVSIESLLAHVAGERGPDDQHVVRDGYGTVLDTLAGGLDVVLGSPVRQVRWHPGRVVLQAGDVAVRARAAVVTVPPAVVTRGCPVFDPALPASTREAAARLGNGDGLVVAVELDRPAPETEHVLVVDEPLGMWRTTGGSPVVLGVATARAADRLRSALGGPDAPGAVVRHLFPGLRAATVRSHRIADWGADPWACGAFSHLGPGRLDAGRAWTRPVASTLFFAGEAGASPAPAASVGGASTSGRSAAHYVLEVLHR